jgi:cysteine desulfurase/selenocysteine lyase
LLSRELKNRFPLLKANPDLAYLDSAASTQKPKEVIDAVSEFYSEDYANIHRGVYELSHRSTEHYDKARACVATFLGASSPNEIVFTRGATEGINLIAQTFGRSKVGAGDVILLSTLEHHANIVPWQMLAEQVGASIEVLAINEAGEFILDDLDRLLSERVKLISLSHTSNALGSINPIEKIIEKASEAGIPTVIDGSQAVSHMPVDVQKLNCDFYVFSGHKLYGPTGIGALYGKLRHLEAMPPYQGGGDMINKVSFEATSYAEPPSKFEAGTPHIAGAVGLRAAIEFLTSFDWDEIIAHEIELLAAARAIVSEIENIRIIGTSEKSVGIVSFVHATAHAHDIATVLSTSGVAVRAGHHCCQPLMKRFGLVATTRASFGIYNSLEDVEKLSKALNKVSALFK